MVTLGLLGCQASVGESTTTPEESGSTEADGLPGAEPRADELVVAIDADSSDRCLAPQYRMSMRDAVVLAPLDGAPPPISDEEITVSLSGDFDSDGREDFILNLGMCGNWAECIHWIVLGCGDDRVSLAAEPDLYAYGFELIPDADGVAQLWELTRGGSADNDDLGRRRWIVVDGRAHPTADWQLIQRGPY